MKKSREENISIEDQNPLLDQNLLLDQNPLLGQIKGESRDPEAELEVFLKSEKEIKDPKKIHAIKEKETKVGAEAREERDRIRAEKEEDDKRWAAARRPRRPSTGPKSFTDTDFQPLGDPASLAGFSPGLESGMARTPPWANNRPQSAFASLATPGTSPDAHRTVWGTAAVVPTSPSLASAPTPAHASQVDDGWLQDWEKDLLDESEAVAMVEASLSTRGGRPSGGQKKGKKKKITLMSTGNRRTA